LISQTVVACAADPTSEASTQVAPTQTAPRDSKDEVVPPPTTRNFARGGNRGRIEELMSFCDVDPPCPAGCKVAESGNVCVEKPDP
jgi:hypothetical protein